MVQELIENKPLVSIIIPTKNSADTIDKCLASVRMQSYGKIEIILVDNYSRDETLNIAKKYGTKVYLAGPERSAQVNFGVSRALGKYVYRVDSDFVLEPSVVHEAVQSCEKFGYDAIVIHNTSDPTISFWAKVRKMERDSYRNDKINVAARFWKKEVFESIGGFDVNLIAGDDYDLHNRLLKGGYKIGWIKAQETHIGEPRNMAEIFRKHYFYGQNLGRFIEKNQERALRQLSPLRRSLAKSLSGTYQDPAIIMGFFVYQFLRYTAATLGMLSAKLKSSQWPPA
ncbi:MAG TPA: glycosyltransferase [candidate division Zixibacteria bacterium]|nr:glycosyltransferase [candidate division Zixibacteria bacterium]